MRFVFICLLMVVSELSLSHELPQNNAVLSLHGGRVELTLDIAVGRWLRSLNDPQAWLMGDTEVVIPYDLTDSQKLLKLNELLLKHIKLHRGEQFIAIVNQQMPKQIKHHHQRFVFQGKLAIANSGSELDKTSINIQFPKSLGDVYLKVVQPKFVNIRAGSSASVKLEIGY